MEFSQYVLVLFNRNKFAQLITAMILRGLICKHSKLQAREKKIKKNKKNQASSENKPLISKANDWKTKCFFFYFLYQLSSQTACRFYSPLSSGTQSDYNVNWSLSLSLFFFTAQGDWNKCAIFAEKKCVTVRFEY